MGLSRIRIAYRLPAAFILIVALALATLAFVSFRSARDTLLLSGQQELSSVAAERAEALTDWAEEVKTDVLMQARSPLLANALKSFAAAWDAFGPDAKAQLDRLYAGGSDLPPFQRLEVEDAGDGSVYSRVHARFHDHFRALMHRGNYRDIYLFDTAGTVVYSVAKQSDLGASIGKIGGDAFFAAVRDAISSGQKGQAQFVDFFAYGPSKESSAFFVAPVLSQTGAHMGAVAFRLNHSALTERIGHAAGLGMSGQVFVVGSDGKARSAARGWKDIVIAAGSPLFPALGDQSGIFTGPNPNSDLQGQMTAFAPADFLGVHWIVVVSEELEEVLAAVSNFSRMMAIYGAITLAVAAGIGVLIALGVSLPLRDMARSISTVNDEDYETPVPHVERRDEIGGIGRSLDMLRARLSDAAEQSKEMAFKSAALEATSAALMITDENFTITYVNESVRSMMRTQKSEFQKILRSFDPENLVGVNMDIFHAKPAQIRALIEAPDRLPFRTDIRVGDARVQIELNAVWSEEKDFAGLVVEWVDVTEERRKTAVLNAIESGQIMAECDMEGRLQRWNGNFRKLAAREEAMLAGADFAETVRYDGVLPGAETAFDVLRRGEPVQGRFLIDRSSGQAIVEGGLFPVIDRRGDTTGITLIGSDVTEAQQELRAAEARQQAMQDAQQRVVEALSVGMRDISRGDLTSRLQEPFDPEYEELRSDFNDALENLTRAMRNIAGQTRAMHNETSEIVKAADEMSVRTERQAMTLQETASSLDELTTNITQTANGAARADQVVREARARAEQSGTVVDEAEDAMAQISASSQEIVKVISVIDDISFQTNLLALNAGVEAARAGEAGRGFAVVATEVRALAQRCANAAAEINQLISVSGQHVSRGVELVGVTGETLKKIVGSISEISDYIAEIAQAGKEQSTGLAQVNSAVNQIDHVTQQNAAMFEETTSASHALAQRANSLAETIGHFQVGEAAPAAPVSRDRKTGARRGVQGNLALAPEKTEIADWEDF